MPVVAPDAWFETFDACEPVSDEPTASMIVSFGRSSSSSFLSAAFSAAPPLTTANSADRS